jgi:hypothetical protein
MVIAVMLAVCAPSFGYVLVYNVISRVRAVDSDTESIAGIAVRGYLVMDFNDTTGDFNEAGLITYGKDLDKTKVYTLPDDPGANLAVNGRYQSVSMLTGEGWQIIVVGKITNRYINNTDKQLIAYSMTGNFTLDGGTALYGDLLTGSGSMVMVLNSTKTKAANEASDSKDTVLDNLTILLEDADYVGI